jgi:hypothetical protein
MDNPLRPKIFKLEWTAMSEDPSASGTSDVLFKRVIAISTALALAAAYGWLAGFARDLDGGFSFHWRWQILLWAIIGLASTFYFWRKIWPPENRPPAKRKDIVAGSIALGVPGVWWLIFPLRALSGSGQHFWQVVLGLSIAAAALTFGAWMIVRLGRGFEEEDADNAKVGASNDDDSKK